MASITNSSPTRTHQYYLIALATLFMLSLLVEKGKDVLWINGNHTIFQDVLFSIITNLGDGLIFIPIIVFMLFIRFQYAIMGVLITTLSGLISSLFKHVIFPHMDRPMNFLNNDLLHFVPGIEVHGTNSFPSGHTITIFCAALFLTLIYQNGMIGVISLVIALMVGYSRIYLLQHFLMDVAAGAVIGCFTTYMIWQIFETNNKPEWMSRRINIKTKRRRQLS